MSFFKIIFLLCVFMINGVSLASLEARERGGNQSSTSFENWSPLGSSGGEYPHLDESRPQPELKIASSCFGDESESEEEQFCYPDRNSQQLYGGIPLLKPQPKKTSCAPSECCWDIIKFLDSILECISPCCCP